MSELEFAGVKFKGGKMFAVLTALSTLGGGAWAGFEFYADYMDMKEIVQNIDIDEIAAANQLQLQKLDDAINYTVEIRKDLAGDVTRAEQAVKALEDQVQRAEATVRSLRNDVYAKLDTFEERFRLTLKDNQDTMADLRDKISTNMEESAARIKATQAGIGDTLAGVRDDLNTQSKDVTSSIREVEATVRASEKDVRNVMKETVSELESKMDRLEEKLYERLQEALDNPLAE
jgi:chromosome segregation ATPase